MEFEASCLKVQEPKFDCLLFDLDDTLYPLSSGISSHVKNNIQDYMVEKLGIEESKIENLGNLLYKNYGTTMAGLRAIGYNFDYDEYHSFVHGRLPYDNIKPDPVLKHILKNLRIRKLIFTNGDMIHAVRALKRLGLEDCFEGIICFETLNPPCPSPCDQATKIFDIAGHFSRSGSPDELPRTPVLCKPNVDAMEAALRIANVNPHKAVSPDATRSFMPEVTLTFTCSIHQFVVDRVAEENSLAADFLRRQRAQHSGRQANRSPHSAGWHAAPGEGCRSRAGEHPQYQGGAAGAVG